MATLSLSAVGNVVWLDPNEIRFKIAPLSGLAGIVGGDWDLDRRFVLFEAVKHRSLAQRYRDGARWEETELFQGPYRRRIEGGEAVRGCATMSALLEQYYGRVDGMFAALKANGFDAHAGPLPTLLTGRDQMFIGNQGNHRLAMAQIIGLPKFAGRIVCKHSLA